MLKTLKRYGAVYACFLSSCFAAASTYRLHFILLMVMDQLFYMSMLSSVGFLFDHVSSIGGWGRDQFLLFTAFMLAVDHLHMTFISESFWEFSFDLRTGRLDYILLRPLNTLFTLFARQIRPATVLNGITPWACLVIYGQRVGLDAIAWVSLLPLVLLALTLLTAMEILLSMLMFWTVESVGINFLRMQLQGVSRWPEFIYQGFARRFFTLLVPVLLVGSPPVQFLLDHSLWPRLFSMLGAILLICFAIGWVWRRGLRSYESASS